MKILIGQLNYDFVQSEFKRAIAIILKNIFIPVFFYNKLKDN